MIKDENIPKKPQSYIDDNIISVEINLELGEDFDRNKLHIVVEGKDDLKLLPHLLNDNVNISRLSGKSEVLKKVNETKSYNVIGIVDIDYETNNEIDRIFTYDYCCLEMMIIAEEEVQKKIKIEYQIDLKTIHTILKELLFLSLTRKYNYYHKLKINFDSLSGISKCYNIKEKKIDNIGIINLLKKIDNNKYIIDRYDYNTIINKICSISNIKIERLLNITNGHDFLI